MVLGGGGTPAPGSELACQVLAVCAAVAWLWLVPRGDVRPIANLAIVTGLIVAVPAIQLVPLPPSLWQALPGREALVAALALIGRQDSWRALSIAPHRTLEALLALGPALVAMALASQLDAVGRRTLLKTIAAVGLLSVAVGAMQLAGNGSSPLLFYGNDAGALFGFQANRNSQADVLLIALLALVAVWAGSRSGGAERAGWPGAAALALLLVLGVLLTTSRTGIVLIPVALVFAVRMLRGRLPQVRLPRWTLAATLAAVGALALWAWRSPALGRVLARFDFAGEYRVDIWRDTLFAIGQSWPVGTGSGTFMHAIFPAERLEALGPTLPNRAHNEVLELALEGGLAALVCWALVAGMVLLALRRSLRAAHGPARQPILFAGGALTICALHSLVDYPLRSMALAGLIEVAAEIVLATGNPQSAWHSRHGDGQD